MRLTPGQAYREASGDGVLVDIRPAAQRAEEGEIPGSAVIERFVPNKHLGTYYHWRARALPLVLAFVILSEYVFHFGDNALSGLENWWIGLIR